MTEGITTPCGECERLRSASEIRRRRKLVRNALTAAAYAIAAGACVWFGAIVARASG